MSTPLLLRGVDLAAFAVALVARLRGGGVVVSASGPAEFVHAMRALRPSRRTDLYWAARLTLVNRADDLETFDRVFEAVFADAVLGLDPAGMRQRSTDPVASSPAARPGQGPPQDVDGLPWITRPANISAAAGSEGTITLPDVLPSRIVARADEPFDQFEPEDLRLLGQWLEDAAPHWPRRRTLRRRAHPRGDRIDLRRTVRASRTTGWEPIQLTRTRRRHRDRRIVLICDVSRSMQAYATVYLHLMRAVMMRKDRLRPEVFAFSTSLTRLTAVLSHRSPELALVRANETVADRYGGTHVGRSIGELVSGSHGAVLRGAVVIIASDGWDSDPPDVLVHALARVRRRAYRVVWLNPRAAHADYRPLAGSMAAALPFCDDFMPAHSISGLRDLFDVLMRGRSGPAAPHRMPC
ncbi:VWA containing CoxE family protein [Mycobacterium sp. IS-1742]|uniref:vWA domain-containing protein n=1 Tax=Mycobacterium sp. IS-1742 TaxID=1772285 RepID=UPI00073FCC17|nr:VWA domain-containing protein [Mycobacterium sp. IS-1742]KUI28571.1 VWA containing CoxE family protein [Mycobacterium sp. IS-1742]